MNTASRKAVTYLYTELKKKRWCIFMQDYVFLRIIKLSSSWLFENTLLSSFDLIKFQLIVEINSMCLLDAYCTRIPLRNAKINDSQINHIYTLAFIFERTKHGYSIAFHACYLSE